MTLRSANMHNSSFFQILPRAHLRSVALSGNLLYERVKNQHYTNLNNKGFSFPLSRNLLYNKEKNKMKDFKNTSGKDVSFTSRISQPLTNSSQALRTASASNSRLCRSSHSKISHNSLELGPFSL